jgi:F420-dependent oxidoreductase-like protein
MAFATLESLAGEGRVIAGLGLSGPQIVEGWYGEPWAKPLSRMRDYVAIMRQVFRREGPVAHDGKAIKLPYDGADATGVGKALKPILHPNPALPIYIAAGGPEMVTLTAEIADAWIPMGLSPANANEFKAALDKGAARRDPRLSPLLIHGSTSVRITDDVAGTIARMKPRTALYVGGMGSKDHNFHKDAMARRGYAAEAERIQELFLAGKREEAVATVPDEYLDEGSLLGSPARIKERFGAWAGSGVDALTIHTDQTEAIELMATLV